MGETATPQYPELDERERVLDLKLAHAFGRTPQSISTEARRRALLIEAESVRRSR